MLSNLKTELSHRIRVNQFKNNGTIRSISFFRRKKKDEELPATTDDSASTGELDEAKETVWDHLSEEVIEKIRDRSNLTIKERDRLNGQLSNRIYLTELYQYKTPYVRNLYATFGKQSGLKPGVCWPRKSELEFKKKYDETFHPPLEQLMQELAEDKAKKAKEIKDREDEIRKGLKKLKKLKKDFFARYNEVQSEIKEQEDKEAKRVEENCEFLGYALKPDDPRFEAAAEKKAEIERKEQAKTGAVKKTRQQRMLEELQQLIEKNQKLEEEAKNDKKMEAKSEQIDESDKIDKNADDEIDPNKSKDK